MAKGIAGIFGGNIKSSQINDPFKNIEIPSMQDQMLILQNPELMGQYTPEQIQVMQEMTQSAMEGVNADQGTIDSQNQALQGISEVAKGGLTEADKSASRQIQREVGQQAQARQKAILNSMASRGVLGSGMELAAQLQGEQQSMDQASNQSDRLIQEAQARSLQALGQQGSLAGQMRGQQFGEQSDKARAQDAINQFNTQNRQRIAETNTSNRNQAQQFNLQRQQEIENQRVGARNQERAHNKSLYQTRFGNEMSKAGGTAGIAMAQAKANADAQAAQAAQTGAVMGGIGTIGGAVIGGMYGGPAGAKVGATAGASLSDKNLKENVNDFNADDFLNKLNAHTYDYKDPQIDPNPQAGVMAQDLEKTTVGKGLVEDTPGGKVVDYNKAGPVMLASLVELHKRLKALEGK